MESMARVAQPAETRATEQAAVQTLRVFACLLVVAFHVVGSTSASGMKLGEGTFYRDLVDLLAPLRLPLFTFLSGFVYAYRPVLTGRVGQFAKKKLRRLGLPFVTATTIYYLLTFVAGDVSGRLPIGEGWRIYVFSYAHFWFLQAIALIFAATVVLELIGALATLRVFLATVACATIGGMLFPLFPEGSWFSFAEAIHLMPFFLIGIGANRFREILLRPVVAWACVLVFVVTAAVHAGAVFQIGAVTPPAVAVAVGLSSALALIYFTPRLRWLEGIGSYSFAIYLFHPFAITPTRKILQALDLDTHAVLFTVCLAAGLFAPIVIEILAKRVPLASRLLLGQGQTARARQPAELPA